MSEQPFVTGQCLCGAVRYAIRGEPLRMAQCHCQDCQRASGCGHMSLAFFREADMDIQGDVASYAVRSDAGRINTRYFCPNCGGRLFGANSAAPGVRAVTAGSMDDAGFFKPGAIIYTRRKWDWDVNDPQIKSFAGAPPRPPSPPQ